MKAAARQDRGSSEKVEEIRNRLSEATQKWRESAAMLCEVRKEVARYLTLKRISDRDLRRARRRRRAGSREVREQMERFQTETRGLSFEELRRIFVKVNHLINLPVAKDEAAASWVVLPSFDSGPCQICGLPLPQGRKKFCSETCRKENAAKGNRSFEKPAVGEAEPETVWTDTHEEPNPHPGYGDRNLDCVFYEACLDLAVLEEWESFQCSHCRLKGPQEQLTLETFERMTA